MDFMTIMLLVDAAFTAGVRGLDLYEKISGLFPPDTVIPTWEELQAMRMTLKQRIDTEKPT